MTDARLGGLGREALVDDAGQLRAGSVVREALVAGIGLSVTVTAQSKIAPASTLHLNLAAQVGASSSSRPAFSVHINLGAAIRASSSGANALSRHFSLATQIAARSSSAAALSLHISLAAQAAARSAASAAVTVTAGAPSAATVTAQSQASGALVSRFTFGARLAATSSARAMLGGIRITVRGEVGAPASSIASAAIVTPGGVLLRASAATSVSEAGGHLALHINLVGRMDARSSARSSLPTTMLLHGTITTQSKAQFTPLAVRVLGARITAKSDSAVSAIVATIHTREGAVTMIVA
jgi:hypothetical protein